MAEATQKMVIDSLGYYDLSNEDATKLCQSETHRTGYKHSFTIAFNGRVEIKVEMPESQLGERGIVKPMEWTTIYTRKGYRGLIKNKDSQLAIEEFVASGPNFKAEDVEFTVAGFDNSFTWNIKERKWTPGSTLPRLVK